MVEFACQSCLDNHRGGRQVLFLNRSGLILCKWTRCQTQINLWLTGLTYVEHVVMGGGDLHLCHFLHKIADASGNNFMDE